MFDGDVISKNGKHFLWSTIADGYVGEGKSAYRAVSQEDMSRTEELSTKLRTMSYDHDRLFTMHRAAVEKTANAERETNLHKSKLAYADTSFIFSFSSSKSLRLNLTIDMN